MNHHQLMEVESWAENIAAIGDYKSSSNKIAQIVLQLLKEREQIKEQLSGIVRDFTPAENQIMAILGGFR